MSFEKLTAHTPPSASVPPAVTHFGFDPGAVLLGPPSVSVSEVAPGGRWPASAFGPPNVGSPLPCW